MNRLDDRSYFFDQGVCFECQRCGTCCTGDPGSICVDNNDISRIARYLDFPVSHLMEKYLHPHKNSYSILEDSDGRCLFYEDAGCRIYPVRPNQCLTYPFWFENLRSLKEWRRVSRECPGIGSGSFYSKEQVIEMVRSNMDTILKSRITSNKKYQSYES